MQRNTSEIFQIVRVIIARNLEIDVETIDLDFKFNHFIDRLAAYRQKKSDNRDLFSYLEAANIYIDLAEEFDLQFLMDFTAPACSTVLDLILVIQSKLELGLAGH
jgi:hypothetical protein